MTGRTHDLAAFTALVVAFVFGPALPTLSIATVVAAGGANFLGGLFPDIDQPTSDFWDNFRLGPFVAKVVCPMLGGHRHISHSLFGLLLFGILARVLLRAVAPLILIDLNIDIIWIAFMLGIVSHLLADFVTKEGLPLFWPMQIKVGFPPFKILRMETGGWIEKLIVFPGPLLTNGYLLYGDRVQVLLFFRQYLK